MKAVLCTLSFTIVLASLVTVNGWGGLFNRFSPELLSNLGYGGFSSNRHQPYLNVSLIFLVFSSSNTKAMSQQGSYQISYEP